MTTKTITLTVHVDEKRRVLIDLPDDVPTGPVELEVAIRTHDERPITREQVRARLIAAGLLNPSVQYAPPDAVELSPEERARIGRALAGDKTAAELIDEEREERF